MEDRPTWELVAAGAVIIGVLFFFGRGLPQMLKVSEKAPKDWMGFVLPMVFVVVLVSVVIMFLRG